ncbi:MAG: spermidine/putrescine transport system substrate-binding protein [Verrucomicrobiales bacterium]|jgi:spermidine/putrescine transport system substrate-binding protein
MIILVDITINDQVAKMKSPYKLFNTLLSALAVVFLLPGCLKDDDSSSDKDQNAQAEDVNQIEFLGWSEFISPDAIAAFTKETGIKVVHTETESFDEVRAHLESSPGKYDVVIAESGNITEWVDLKLIRELNHEQLPLMSNMDPQFMNFVTDPGNAHSIPVLSGTTLIAFDKTKVDLENASESWSALWNPALKGKIALLDDPREVFAIGFKKNGFSLNSSDQAEFEKAESDLVALAKDSAPLFGEPFQVLDWLVEGKVAMVHCFSGDAVIYAEENENIEIFHPKEGSTQWVDAWAIARDTERSTQAHQFINYMMRPEVAAMTSNYACYRTPNKAAYELLDKDLREDPFVYPPASILEVCELLDPRDGNREELLQLGMRKLILASPGKAPQAELRPATGEIQQGGE